MPAVQECHAHVSHQVLLAPADTHLRTAPGGLVHEVLLGIVLRALRHDGVGFDQAVAISEKLLLLVLVLLLVDGVLLSLDLVDSVLQASVEEFRELPGVLHVPGLVFAGPHHTSSIDVFLYITLGL